MKRFFFGIGALLLLSLFGGCEEKPSTKELGTVVEGVPHVKGADERFNMPALGPPPPEDPNSRGKHP